MPIKQASRMLAIATGLDKDQEVLGVRSVTINEQLSRLFQIDAELSSEKGEINMDQVIGRNATIRLDIGQNGTRYFNGFVNRMVQVANVGGYAHYRVTIVPWLWCLTRMSDCRIFLDKTVPEIVQEVFNDHGFDQFLDKLTPATYKKKEFCVQYRETDFNFVSRLMEQEGIYYYFQHENGKHTLVLADSISAHKPFPDYEEVIFHELEKGAAGREVITEWIMEKEVQTVAYKLNDFDFKKPRTPLLAASSVTREYGQAQTEMYDYPGGYIEADEGTRLADVRLNELQSQYEVLHGRASARGLAAGCIFKLKHHPQKGQDGEYLITSTTLRADAGEFASAGDGDTGEFFTCNFTAIRKAQQFRPQRITPKPIIQGPQTAIVVGPGGEEIHTEEHGRVKVHFHWDRYGEYDENASCWVRVSQFWAGKTWGTMHIPRIGQEVIVEFLEGDPDYPIITGRVYNGEQVPPYGLPSDKTKSTWKSNSSKGGGGSNELRFEDKKGSEEVFLHGQKDWTIHIQNAENETVGSSISTHAGADISRNAGANINRTANVTITDKAGKDIIWRSKANMDLESGGSYQLYTNLGIHLKTMNFVAAAIESGAKAAVAAIAKGGAAGAAGQQGAAGKAAGAAHGAAEAATTTAVDAMGPALAGVSADLSARQAEAEKNMDATAKAGSQASQAASALHQAIASGAGRDAIAGAAMALAGAALDTYKDLKKTIEDMLPQIPSIVMWAMKDINGTALWSMTFETKARDITLVAQNKDINIQAKKNINISAKQKDVSIIADKENINLKAGKNFNFEAAEEICIKTGDAKIVMKKDGSITIEGKDIVLKASGKMEVKSDSDMTVTGSKVAIN